MNNDLISREALKRALNFVYNCAYIDSRSKEGIASDIIVEIDKAQAVEYTFEEAFQKTVCEQRLYCPSRLQGEWIIDGHHIRCNRCNEYICNTDREGNKIPNNFCPNCGAKMAGSDMPIK